MLQILTILLLTFVSPAVKPTTELQLSETEKWKLSWRMYWSLHIKDYELGERQFDSLLATKSKLANRFVFTGLEILNQRGDLAKITQILPTLDSESLEYLCGRNFIHKTSPDFEHCRPFNYDVSLPQLRLELVKMYVNDQVVRDANMDHILSKYDLKKENVVKALDGVAIDKENRTRLQEIIAEHGFPTRKMVGSDAVNGVFLIIQHSDGDRVWQKTQLPNIELAVKRGDMDGQNYAYLYDRIKINTGEKQLYGTQFMNVDAKTNTAELGATEDPDNLDKRRMEVGMMPIEMYKKFMLSSLKK